MESNILKGWVGDVAETAGTAVILVYILGGSPPNYFEEMGPSILGLGGGMTVGGMQSNS